MREKAGGTVAFLFNQVQRRMWREICQRVDERKPPWEEAIASAFVEGTSLQALTKTHGARAVENALRSVLTCDYRESTKPKHLADMRRCEECDDDSHYYDHVDCG